MEIKFKANRVDLDFFQNKEVRVLIFTTRKEYDNIKEIKNLPDGIYLVSVSDNSNYVEFDGYNIIPKLMKDKDRTIKINIDISDDQYNIIKDFPLWPEGVYEVIIRPKIDEVVIKQGDILKQAVFSD